jgi:phosphorylcholine metabolism protein LicD
LLRLNKFGNPVRPIEARLFYDEIGFLWVISVQGFKFLNAYFMRNKNAERKVLASEKVELRLNFCATYHTRLNDRKKEKKCERLREREREGFCKMAICICHTKKGAVKVSFQK